MNKRHPNGYWVQKLTDENTKDLLDLIVSTQKTKKFKEIFQQTKTDNSIIIKYVSINLHSYWKYSEGTLVITDYAISGQHPYTLYSKFMAKLFGEEYVNDFLDYANEYLANAEEDNLIIKKLRKNQNEMSSILNQLNNSTNNEI